MPTKDVKQIEDMCCLSVCQLVHVSNAHSGSMRPYPCKANLQISAVWLIRHLGFPDAVGYSLGLIGCPMGLKIRASCILSAKAGAVPVLISPCSCFDHMTALQQGSPLPILVSAKGFCWMLIWQTVSRPGHCCSFLYVGAP